MSRKVKKGDVMSVFAILLCLFSLYLSVNYLFAAYKHDKKIDTKLEESMPDYVPRILSRGNNRIARDILVILDKGPNRPVELRKELGVNSANYFTSRYLTPMLEDGFIEREKGVDKCSSQVRYMITSKGRKVIL